MSNLESTAQEELAGGITSPLEFVAETPAVSHSAERNRRLRKSLITAAIFRPLAMVISFVSVPLFVKYLGPEAYGLYEAIIAFSMWLSLANAGLAIGLVNRLTDCYVSNDRELARRYVSSIWYAIAALVLVLSLLLSAITPFVNWQGLFPTSDAHLRATVPWVVWVTGIVTFISMLLGVPGATYFAHQELDRNNYWDAASKLAMLGACFLIVLTPFGLIGVAFVTLAVPALVRSVNTVWMFSFEKPWLSPRLHSFDSSLLKKTMGDGFMLFILQMASVAIFQSDKLIISATRGGTQVTGFAIVGRLYLQLYGVFCLLLFSLWPAYSEAIRRNDIAWVKRNIRYSILVGLTVILGGGLTLCYFGDFVIRLWTRGTQTSVSRPLVIATMALFLCRVVVDCLSVVLNAASVLLPQVIFMSINAVLNLLVGIVLGRKYGAVGVAWSFPITAVCTSLWAYPWLIRRHLWTKWANRAHDQDTDNAFAHS